MASALNGKIQIGNLEDFPACKDILPEGYDYEICSYKDEAFALDDEKQFSAIVRTRALTKEGVQSWLEKFAIRSGSIFRVDRTHKPGCRTAFKVQYRCHHNTRPRKNSRPHAKHSNCNAKLTINVKRNVKRPHLSKDGYLPEFPTVIMLRHTHNHHLCRSESLRFTDPSSSVRDRFLSLFESGHSVASALALYTADVLESHDVSVHPRVMTDRRVVPGARWVRYLHDKVFDRSRANTPLDQLVGLRNFVQRYNAKCGEECVKMEDNDQQHFSLAVCSPLMKRVHQLNNCGEFLLVDSSSNCTRFLCRVYVLQVHTAVGGLPVGVLVTSLGLKKGLTKALELYTQLLPRNSFGGQTSGPSLIILGPSADEHNAFSKLFPNSTLIPSVYHCLLNFWNFLITSEHLIPTQLVPHAYLLIRRLLRSSNSDELSLNYNAVTLHPITNNYPKFEQQVSEVYEQVKGWAQFAQQGEESVCGIVEASIEAFRDRILTRTKAVNPVQLLEFVVDSMEKFYLCKIECALLGQENEWFANEFREVLSVQTQVQHLRVTCDVDVNDCVFEVTSHGDQYVVDVMLGLCSCFVGRTGAKCCHQLAVKRERDLPKLNFQVLADDEDARRFYQKMLVDCGRTSDEFLALPEDGANVEVSSAHADVAYLAYASEENAAQVETVKASLRQVFDDVMHRLQSNPQQLLPAVQSFVSGYHTLKNDLDKIEALNSFARGRSSSPNVVLLPYDLMASITQR